MNFRFQRRTDLAFRILRRLGVPRVRVSGPSLSSSIGTTTSFLPEVVAPLIERGWITSERGPGGGYALTDASLDISVFDVLVATEGPNIEARCVLRDQPCPGDEACLAHAVWADARETLINGLQSIPAIPSQGELI